MVEPSYCHRCAAPLMLGWTFCATCGAPVSDSDAPEGAAEATSIESEPLSSLTDEPAEDAAPVRIPGSYVPPASTLTKPAPPLVPMPGPTPAPMPAPYSASTTTAEPVPTPAPAADEMRPTAAASASAIQPASRGQAGKESVPELVAFGLVAAGAAVGIASLFLPWANGNGIGIGNYAISSPPPNQWGWGMPASLPLLLLSGLMLGAITGKDRAQARFPNLALAIGRVVDVILALLLGGVYLGVFLLYVTLPSGYGIGVAVLLLGGGLLIAGGVASLFFPAEVKPGAD